jgi:hypothetical protein
MNRGQTTRNVPLRWIQLLDSSSPAFLIISSPSKNQSKTSPKSDRFRPYKFFNTYPTTTYNFNILKRSDFSPLVARALSKLPGSPNRRVRASVIGPPPQRLRVSAVKTCQNILYKIERKRTKSNAFPKHLDFGHTLPTTYDDMPSGRSILQEVPMTLPDHLLNSGLPLGPSSEWVFIVPIP